MSENKNNPENNTDEIDQIMAELDQLQKQVPAPKETLSQEVQAQLDEVSQAEAPSRAPAAPTLLEDIRAESNTPNNESSLEESFGDMKQDDIHSDTHFPGDPEGNVRTFPNNNHSHKASLLKGDSPKGTLSMTLSGDMNLELRYAQGGDEVQLSFEDGYFSVTLNNGAQFKVPLQSSAHAEKKIKTAV